MVSRRKTETSVVQLRPSKPQAESERVLRSSVAEGVSAGTELPPGLPLHELGAEEDEVVPSAQLLAMADLVSTQPKMVTTQIVPGRHLSLFMGQRTLKVHWPMIASFLSGA